MATDWIEENNTLKKTFVFSDFMEAMQWMQKASTLIDDMNHHPEWKNVYNKIEVTLCTHDAGNIITEKDRRLAKILDSID